jgi:tRNA threonylcarbamoyladenosine biosynthesis protein TsaE
MKKTITYSLQDIPEVVEQLKEVIADCRVVTLTGPLGAGKTTLIKKLLKEMGVQDRVTSPTFTYMQQYANQEGTAFYHFDLYRIARLQDFVQAGFQEYLYQPQSLSIIEWPEVIEPLLLNGTCRIAIGYHDWRDSRAVKGDGL